MVVLGRRTTLDVKSHRAGKTDRRRPAPHRHSRKSGASVMPKGCECGGGGDKYAAGVGYDDAPHGSWEVLLENVRVRWCVVGGGGGGGGGGGVGGGRRETLLLGRVAASRSPRAASVPSLHHCMRTLGAAEWLGPDGQSSESASPSAKAIADHSIWNNAWRKRGSTAK